MKLSRGGGRDGRGSGPSLANLFSTHPSLEKRLAQLAKIQQQLGSATPGGAPDSIR
jgi:Zn-dependent protease with chaperone function